MKKIFLILLTLTLAFSSNHLLADGGPPPPPGDPSTGDGPVGGGGAPIGSGIAILLTLGAAYGGRKVYQYWKSQNEELEE
jgi:hypothetical protein